MRTKRFLTTTAAMLVMLAIIGSGFSYWFFTISPATADQTPSREVTQLVEAGSITAADAFTIRFDQTVDGRTINGSSTTLYSGESLEGITVQFASGATNKAAKYTGPVLSGGYGSTGVATDIAYTFTVTLKISNDLAEYVTVALRSGVTDWTMTENTEDGDDNNKTYVFTSTTDKEFHWETDVEFSYADAKEPTNKSTYEAFVSIVTNASITVSYSAVIGTNS